MTQMLCGVLYRTDVIYVSRKRQHGYLGIAFVMIKKNRHNVFCAYFFYMITFCGWLLICIMYMPFGRLFIFIVLFVVFL